MKNEDVFVTWKRMLLIIITIALTLGGGATGITVRNEVKFENHEQRITHLEQIHNDIRHIKSKLDSIDAKIQRNNK